MNDTYRIQKQLGKLYTEDWYCMCADMLAASPLFYYTTLETSLDVIDWRIRMAKKQEQDKGKDKIGEWNGIVNIPINDDAKKRAQDVVAKEPDWLVDSITTLMERDYKLVLRWDERSDCPQISLSCYAQESPNFKRTVITRAPNWLLCLALTAIKHFEIAEEVWTEADSVDSWS